MGFIKGPIKCHKCFSHRTSRRCRRCFNSVMYELRLLSQIVWNFVVFGKLFGRQKPAIMNTKHCLRSSLN